MRATVIGSLFPEMGFLSMGGEETPASVFFLFFVCVCVFGFLPPFPRAALFPWQVIITGRREDFSRAAQRAIRGEDGMHAPAARWARP